MCNLSDGVYEAGKAEGKETGHKETALRMLRKQKPLSEVMEFTDLTKETVLQLAKENGLEVVIG